MLHLAYAFVAGALVASVGTLFYVHKHTAKAVSDASNAAASAIDSAKRIADAIKSKL